MLFPGNQSIDIFFPYIIFHLYVYARPYVRIYGRYAYASSILVHLRLHRSYIIDLKGFQKVSRWCEDVAARHPLQFLVFRL